MKPREHREYQSEAAAAILAHWRRGARSVCLVGPTGSGKTEIAMAIMTRGSCLAVAHRRDLVAQLADVLAARFGKDSVGVLMAGRKQNPSARIQVGTVQTLPARGVRPDVEKLFWDEVHHAPSAEWRALAVAYPNARFVGATATPERSDGTPLGDICEEMVVAASYSSLIAAGHLVPARVFQPREFLGSDLATSPLHAWQRYGNGAQAFVFCMRVEIAETVARSFRGAGVSAQCIAAETPHAIRVARLDAFRAGKLRVITNVATMTEGIDVPDARCCILAHDHHHVSGYLQECGRVLRASPGKLDAIILDLVGSSHRHGSPSDDRTYSLEGRPIRRVLSRDAAVAREEFVQETRNLDLVEARSATLTAPAAADAKDRRAVFEALRSDADLRGLPRSTAAIRYRDRFGEYPPVAWRER